MSSPLLWGPNNTAINLQNGMLQANGMLNKNDGAKNYITYNNFENGLTTGYSLGTTGTLTNGVPTGTPTFGSGTTNLTLGVTTSNPLAGTTSLQLVASAATTAGNMVATDALTIDIEDQAKILNWKFAYSIPSGVANGNFSGTSSNSFAVAAWDVTNSVWLSNTGNFSLVQASGVGIASGTFQTGATTASIRLIIYAANASAGAITINMDSFFMGPQQTLIGYAGTDYQAYTPTFTGFGTVGNVTFASARVGDRLIIRGYFTAGTTTATEARISLGFNAGNSNVSTPSSGLPLLQAVGYMKGGTASTTFFGEAVVTIEPSVNYLTFNVATSTAGYTKTGGTAFTTGGTYSLYAEVPIAGWSTNTALSNDTDTRQVFCQVSAAGTVTNATPAMVFPVVLKDSHNTYNAATGVYTVPVSGDYMFSFYNFVRSVSGTITGNVYIDGAAYTLSPVRYTDQSGVGGSFLLPGLRAGQTLSFGGGGSLTYSAGTYAPIVTFQRLAGPAVIAAAESVNMKYTNTAGTSLSNAGFTNVPFATRVYDSHNAWNGTQFVAPIAGKYSVKATINFASATYGVNNSIVCAIYRNGSLDTAGAEEPIMAIVTLPFGGDVATTVQCNPGDTVELRVFNTRSGGSTALATTTGYNHIEIERVGN